jgi:3-oxoacyl-[acyl-carrier protein] reductase
VEATQEVVRLFSELTGDVSSLHTDASFARRSSYRQPVVHGMLPLAFLPLLEPFCREETGCILTEITGRFSAPVFHDDTLKLILDPGGAAVEGHTFAYRVERDGHATPVTTGTIAVAYVDPGHQPAMEPVGPAEGLLADDMRLNSYRMDEIERGMEDHLDFRATDGAVRSFYRLLEAGAAGGAPGTFGPPRPGFHLPNLFAALLFSTSVGVSLPGASATFLEFEVRFRGPLEMDRDYRLQSRVLHRSRSTNIVKKAMSVDSGQEQASPLVEGKVSSLVNPPSSSMPTVRELRASALDLGLKDKVVLVTGASRGIGETTAKLFSLLGSKVIVNYHRGAKDASRVAEEINMEGGEAVAVAGDVTNPGDVRRLVGAAIERFGTVHILVNNAARDFRPTPFLDLSWDEVERDLEVAAKGAFLCCQAVLPLMLEQNGGKIVNITSLATDAPPPNQTKYVIAKSALMGLTRSLAVEFASKNVQINMVVPNFVETDLVAHISQGFRRKIAQDIPMGRLGSPIDVAQAVVYLSSSLSSFTTGQRVMVTGGAVPLL